MDFFYTIFHIHRHRHSLHYFSPFPSFFPLFLSLTLSFFFLPYFIIVVLSLSSLVIFPFPSFPSTYECLWLTYLLFFYLFLSLLPSLLSSSHSLSFVRVSELGVAVFWSSLHPTSPPLWRGLSLRRLLRRGLLLTGWRGQHILLDISLLVQSGLYFLLFFFVWVGWSCLFVCESVPLFLVSASV